MNQSGMTSVPVTSFLKNLTYFDEQQEEEEGNAAGLGMGSGGGLDLGGVGNASAPGNESEYVWDEDELLYRHSLHIAVLLCFSYVLVFLLGLVGNCFVIAVVFRSVC